MLPHRPRDLRPVPLLVEGKVERELPPRHREGAHRRLEGDRLIPLLPVDPGDRLPEELPRGSPRREDLGDGGGGGILLLRDRCAAQPVRLPPLRLEDVADQSAHGTEPVSPEQDIQRVGVRREPGFPLCALLFGPGEELIERQCGHRSSGSIASASISTTSSGSMRRVISTIVLAGRISAKISPWARPAASHWVI